MDRVLILRSGWAYKPIPQELVYEAYADADDVRFSRLYAYREKFHGSVPLRYAFVSLDNEEERPRANATDELQYRSQMWKPRLRTSEAPYSGKRKLSGSDPVVLRPMPSLAQEHLMKQLIKQRQRLQELARLEEEDDDESADDESSDHRQASVWRVFDCSPSIHESPATFILCTVLLLFVLIYVAAWLDSTRVATRIQRHKYAKIL